MLPKASRDVGTAWPPTFTGVNSAVASLTVESALYLMRMAHALDLVAGGQDVYTPLQEGSLSWWLYGSTVVIGPASFGAIGCRVVVGLREWACQGRSNPRQWKQQRP